MTRLKAGDWVEVRSREEILATLDSRGQLDNMPFMPEMFEFCGKRFEVWSRAHKTCDTVNKTGGRWLPETVHLKELRCDGKAHGGCDAGCLLFWKEAWLKPLEGSQDTPKRSTANGAKHGATEQDVWAGIRAPGDKNDEDPTYVCQATALPSFTSLAHWWDVRQYVEDLASGNVGVRNMVNGVTFVLYQGLVNKSRKVSNRVANYLVYFYDQVQERRGGVPFPRKQGTIPAGQKTTSRPLNLKAGDLVRVRTHLEILHTLDTNNRNKGMFFDAEEVPFCGKTFRVRNPVTKIINEQTGKMRQLKDSNVILEGAYCKAWYSDRRMYCPRAIFPIWRETWLERVSEDAPAVELATKDPD